MKPEIKELWTGALRSGEYRQTIATLIEYEPTTPNKFEERFIPTEEDLKNASYCCLGVLCDLYRKATGNNLWERTGFDDTIGVLPISVTNWAGLHNSNPYVKSPDDPDPKNKITLTDCNDHKSFNFNQIADLIEEGL